MSPLRQNLGTGMSCRQRPATPGVNHPLGPPSRTINLYAQVQVQSSDTSTTSVARNEQASQDDTQILSSGSAGAGVGSQVRIPIPGSNGLAIELIPPKYWKGDSTSALFFQSADGKRILRLDYGYNKQTGKVDYHWNQSGTTKFFGISDHSSAGRAGEALYKGAKFFKFTGTAFFVYGLATDLYSVVVAKKRWRRAAQVAAGWAGAWAGCKVGAISLGAAGGAIGTIVPVAGNGIGASVGAFAGCLVGGVGGYYYGSEAGEKIYDWVEETYYEPLAEEPTPP